MTNHEQECFKWTADGAAEVDIVDYH